MLRHGSFASFLTLGTFQQAVLLTLTLLLATQTRLSHADNLPPAEAALLKQRVNEVTTYVRKQAFHGLSILPNEMRDAAGWFSGSWRPVAPEAEEVTSADPTVSPSTVSPALLAQPSSSSFGLATNFHHKGFFPLRDAMVMGYNMKQDLIPDKLDISARPFYGQNWRSVRGYWGAEASVNILQHEDGLPWGKIALGYVGGNEDLTDHGRGLEMHGDVDLTNHFKFTSGIRQNSSDGNSNYMLVRWHYDLD